jgi:hypothetical protein
MDPLVTKHVSRVVAKRLGARPCRNGRFWREAVVQLQSYGREGPKGVIQRGLLLLHGVDGGGALRLTMARRIGLGRGRSGSARRRRRDLAARESGRQRGWVLLSCVPA